MRPCSTQFLGLALIVALISPRRLAGQELPVQNVPLPDTNQFWASLGAGPRERSGVIWHLAGWAARGPVVAGMRFTGVAVGHWSATDRLALSALLGARPPLQRSTLILVAGMALVMGTDPPPPGQPHSSYRIGRRPVAAGAIEWTADFSLIGLGVSYTAIGGQDAFYGLALLLKFGAAHARAGS